MTDKYLNIDLHDEKAAAIAEVITNKTCKKILDLLADKEMSESELSSALSIPLNTVGYNIKKLKEARLIEEVKSFWSVKGKKVPFYRLANKKIIISPKRLHPLVIPLSALFAIMAIIALIAFIPYNKSISNQQEDNSLKYFSSYEELNQFIKNNQIESSNDGFFGFAQKSSGRIANSIGAPMATSAVAEDSSGAGSSSSSVYSQTNIQVEGVDEPDIMKNDGKYIYTITGNNVTIVEAFPVENMRVLSNFGINGTVSQLFLNQDKLVIIGTSYEEVPRSSFAQASERIMPCLGYRCGGYSKSFTKAWIFDISDRAHPSLENELTLEGNYLDARMIGDTIYLISNQYQYGQDVYPPLYRINGAESKVAPTDIAYFPHEDTSFTFTSVMAFSLENEEVNTKTYLLSASSTVYASEDNLYLVATKYLSQEDYQDRAIEEVILPILQDSEQDKINDILDSSSSKSEQWKAISIIIQDYSDSLRGNDKSEFDSSLAEAFQNFSVELSKQSERTVIHKISLDKTNIEYLESGDVPGHILNQFSMDEYQDNFRIATTTGDSWNGNSLNHLFVLDDSLNLIGSVEDLAPGESIYSVRFMGKRAYIVTFKKIDPFYALDLSDPFNPQVLGYLKIPGYSNYLHPYDENHIIGIGKDAVDASSGELASRNLDFAWYQGMKISLFDVTDVENPIEQAKFTIGERGTDSPVLYDHKALLFDKEKNLLVFPVSEAKINRSKYNNGDCEYEWECKLTPSTYGDIVWQGAYVFHIDENDITLKNKISHFDEKKIDESNRYWYYDDMYSVKRSLFMDDTLYTVSSKMIKANDLNSGDELNKLILPYSGYYYGGPILY